MICIWKRFTIPCTAYVFSVSCSWQGLISCCTGKRSLVLSTCISKERAWHRPLRSMIVLPRLNKSSGASFRGIFLMTASSANGLICASGSGLQIEKHIKLELASCRSAPRFTDSRVDWMVMATLQQNLGDLDEWRVKIRSWIRLSRWKGYFCTCVALSSLEMCWLKLTKMIDYLVSKQMSAITWMSLGSAMPPPKAEKSMPKLLIASAMASSFPSSKAMISLARAFCLTAGRALHCPKSSKTSLPLLCTAILA